MSRGKLGRGLPALAEPAVGAVFLWLAARNAELEAVEARARPSESESMSPYCP